MSQKRKSGILLHPSSLPSKYGIGDFGQNAFQFVEKLYEAKQTLWQVLPLCPVDYSGSPYQSPSSFAGEPLFISLEELVEDGLLTEEDVNNIPPYLGEHTDYAVARRKKLPLLKKAYDTFAKQIFPHAYTSFYNENAFWLEDYALFAALKGHLQKERQKDEGGLGVFLEETKARLPKETAAAYYESAVWCSFPPALRQRNPHVLKKWRETLVHAMGFETFLQYIFHKQWQALKAFANEKGIAIIGDAPIFVAYDSADVWANQKLFLLDASGFQKSVAGVPPDYFSETGQLWGNPLYDWVEQEKTGYDWWVKRIKKTITDADIVRIDHFRGFETYWEIPFGAKDARGGKWMKGPGLPFFHVLEEKLGKLPLIAEDLGIITDEVRALRKAAGFPGMCILQFAFGNDRNNAYLPHSYEKNTVVYTGTHDNDTTLGWYQQASDQEKDHYRRYMNVAGNDPAWDFIRLAFSSTANMAIIPLQDVLNLDGSFRMNMPGTVQGNWSFSFGWNMWDEGYTQGLRELSQLFGRNKE